MKVRFKCHCGAVLLSPLRGIGRSLECPNCRKPIVVPAPSATEVQSYLAPIPRAFPNQTSTDYLKLMGQIQKAVEFNVRVCKLTGHATLAQTSIDTAKRVLRNIAAFLNDTLREASFNPLTAPSDLAPALARMAAGSDFAGIGTTKSKRRSYKRWLKKHPSTEDEHAGTKPPLNDYVASVIEWIDSLM